MRPKMCMVLLTALLIAPALLAVADESAKKKAKNAKKVSVLIRGAHCEKDEAAIRAALAKVKGAKFNKDDVRSGEKPRYFSDPFVVELADPSRVDVGALAEMLSKSKTPHAKKYPVKVNVVLYSEDRIDEESVSALRQSLGQVNGLEVNAPGGLGGFPNKGYYWVQLEDAGGAGLQQILDASRNSGLKLSTVKKSDD